MQSRDSDTSQSPQSKLYFLKRAQRSIFRDITNERIRQNIKFAGNSTGAQYHSLERWNLILGEERGEAEQAILDLIFGRKEDRQSHISHLRDELIQTAAVAVAIIERIDAEDPALFATVDEP